MRGFGFKDRRLIAGNLNEKIYAVEQLEKDLNCEIETASSVEEAFNDGYLITRLSIQRSRLDTDSPWIQSTNRSNSISDSLAVLHGVLTAEKEANPGTGINVSIPKNYVAEEI